MIEFTEAATQEITKIQKEEEGTEELHLRVMVVSAQGGAMNYRLGFDPKPPEPSDKKFEIDGIKVVIDARSGLFLKGTKIDFVDGVAGKGFIFHNPNARKPEAESTNR